MTQFWTIKEVAKLAGTTSRTLRHYDQIGLLKPSDFGENGYRHYDTSALIRLQRILALRDLGMSLTQIQAVLDRDLTEIEALADLEQQLLQESSRLERQIASVQRTLSALEKGDIPVADNMFDGYEHEQFKDEVEERWGKDAWANSNNWWSSLGEEGQKAYQQKMTNLINDWQSAYRNGESPDGEIAQNLARQNVEFLKETPGPHTSGECTLETYVRNLGDMYVNDERFAATYGGIESATFVRDSLHGFVDTLS